MTNKKKKIEERAFVAISVQAHAVIKKYAVEERYTIGGFMEKAALEKIEKDKKK